MKRTALAIIALALLTGCGTVDPSVITNLLTNSVPPAVSNDVPPVVVEPEPEPDTPPPDLSGVEMNNGIENSIGWPITVEIENVRIEGPAIVWTYTSGLNRQRKWPIGFEDLNACVNIVCTIGGKEVAFVAEWLRPGGTSQRASETLRSVRSNGKKIFKAPYENLVIGPEHNPQFYLSGLNFSRTYPTVKINVRERTNAVRIQGL